MCYLCMGKSELDIQRVHGGWPGRWVASATQDPPDPPTSPALSPGSGSTAPVAPAKPGVFGGGIVRGVTVPAYGPGQGPKPITKVNSTTDTRILWEDGNVAVIYAKDFPAGTGMGRSRTRPGLQEVLGAVIDDQLQTAPGASSQFELVKVWLRDILARPIASQASAKVVGRLPMDPKHFAPVAPVVATGGRYKGQVIPDFPHDCAACGGKCYQGMFSNVHDTLDGRCPAETGHPKPRKR